MIEIIHPKVRQVIQLQPGQYGDLRIRSIVRSGQYDLLVDVLLIQPLIDALQQFQKDMIADNNGSAKRG